MKVTEIFDLSQVDIQEDLINKEDSLTQESQSLTEKSLQRHLQSFAGMFCSLFIF